MDKRTQAISLNQTNSVRSIRTSILHRHRSVPHFGRKFYHFLMGIICFSLYAFALSRSEALVLLAGIGGALVIGDLIRLRYASVNNLALRLFGGLMRREELKSVSGNSFYVLGLFTIVLLFPKNIVLLSVLFLAIGDPSAAVVGSLYGKHKIIGKKSIEGAGANLVLSSIAALLFGLLYVGLSPTNALLLATIGGITSMVAELTPAPVDDNFSIPLISATILTAISILIPQSLFIM